MCNQVMQLDHITHILEEVLSFSVFLKSQNGDNLGLDSKGRVTSTAQSMKQAINTVEQTMFLRKTTLKAIISIITTFLALFALLLEDLW